MTPVSALKDQGPPGAEPSFASQLMGPPVTATTLTISDSSGSDSGKTFSGSVPAGMKGGLRSVTYEGRTYALGEGPVDIGLGSLTFNVDGTFTVKANDRLDALTGGEVLKTLTFNYGDKDVSAASIRFVGGADAPADQSISMDRFQSEGQLNLVGSDGTQWQVADGDPLHIDPHSRPSVDSDGSYSYVGRGGTFTLDLVTTDTSGKRTTAQMTVTIARNP
jgi:hypothetical protein